MNQDPPLRPLLLHGGKLGLSDQRGELLSGDAAELGAQATSSQWHRGPEKPWFDDDRHVDGFHCNGTSLNQDLTHTDLRRANPMPPDAPFRQVGCGEPFERACAIAPESGRGGPSYRAPR